MRHAIAAVLLLSEAGYLYFTGASNMGVVLSSLAVTAALMLQLRFGIDPDAPTPVDIVVFIFNWLFLDLAPKIQLISESQVLVNTSPVDAARVMETNLVCALSMLAFTLAYASMIKRSKAPEVAPAVAALRRRAELAAAGRSDKTSFEPVEPDNGPTLPREISAFGLGLAVVICLVMVAALGRNPYAADPNATITPMTQVLRKFLLFLPSATLLISWHAVVRTGKKLTFTHLCALVLLAAMVAYTENPLTEKRNALGPVYLGLIFVVAYQRLRSLNAKLGLLVFAMVLIFPAITVMTHNRRQFMNGVKMSDVSATLKDHYVSVNYDAWANTYTVIEMVGRQGLRFGHQLLGDFLFWVPSAIWHGKPVATGVDIGNYLILNHGGWFTNLSAPLQAEGYIDFGVLGVIIYSIALAWIARRLNRFAQSNHWVAYPSAVYASLFLMFALRGSFMIAFAYSTGGLMAFIVAHWALTRGQQALGKRYSRATWEASARQGTGAGRPAPGRTQTGAVSTHLRSGRQIT